MICSSLLPLLFRGIQKSIRSRIGWFEEILVKIDLFHVDLALKKPLCRITVFLTSSITILPQSSVAPMTFDLMVRTSFPFFPEQSAAPVVQRLSFVFETILSLLRLVPFWKSIYRFPIFSQKTAPGLLLIVS